MLTAHAKDGPFRPALQSLFKPLAFTPTNPDILAVQLFPKQFTQVAAKLTAYPYVFVELVGTPKTCTSYIKEAVTANADTATPINGRFAHITGRHVGSLFHTQRTFVICSRSPFTAPKELRAAPDVRQLAAWRGVRAVDVPAEGSATLNRLVRVSDGLLTAQQEQHLRRWERLVGPMPWMEGDRLGEISEAWIAWAYGWGNRVPDLPAQTYTRLSIPDMVAWGWWSCMTGEHELQLF